MRVRFASPKTRLIVAVVVSVLFLAGVFTWESLRPTASEITLPKAVVLGVVEGVTEYLPVSSTGHLEISNRLMGIGQTEKTQEAASAYTISIQAGAILAVLVLYFGRIRSVVLGIFGRDAAGRRLGICLALSFLPAAIIGVLLEKPIKEHLFGVGPIVFAWIVGGLIILWWSAKRNRDGLTITEFPYPMAFSIGLAQCIAMWPGTSRSLVTIMAAVMLGGSLAAGVEYAFLLGLITLGAATAYDVTTKGTLMLDAFGFAPLALGFLVAFVVAVVSVRWMVAYLNRHSFAIFGWYRLAIGAVALVLILTNVL